MSLMPLPPLEGFASYLSALNVMDGSVTRESPEWLPGRDASQPQLPMESKKSLDDLDEEDDADEDEEDDDELDDEDEEDEDEDEVDDDYDEDEDGEDDDEDEEEDEDEEDEDGGVKPLKMA